MYFYKVEDEDDIQNVPASAAAGGSEVKGETSSSNQDAKSEDRAQETSTVNINTSDLPPHILLEMPALSPTMVQIELSAFLILNFLFLW